MRCPVNPIDYHLVSMSMYKGVVARATLEGAIYFKGPGGSTSERRHSFTNHIALHFSTV